MKKLLAGLLLVSSVLSYGELLYLEGQQKPYSGEVERKYPNGKLLGLATMKDGKLEGKAYVYYENGKVIEQTTFKNGQQVK